METVQARHQPVSGEGEIGGHLQHLVLRPRTYGFQARAYGLQSFLHMQEQQASAVGQLDAAVDAIEQAGRQLLLQALDLLAHRGLGGAQLHRGGGEAQMAGSGFEYPQQVQGEFRRDFCHKPHLSESCFVVRFTEPLAGVIITRSTFA
ncbi:hypothetical protein D3C84_336020 [compost metagenome]